MRSIRAQMILWMVCGMAVLLTAFAVVVYEVMLRSLRDGFDAVLASTARTICGFVEQSGDALKVEVDETQVPEFNRSKRPDFFQIWREDGGVLARSFSSKGENLDRFAGALESPVYRTVHLPDGRDGRAVGLLFVPKADEEAGKSEVPQKAILVVARETASMDAEISYLRWLLASATGGGLLLTLVVGTLVVRQGLGPLDELAGRIASIRHDDLSTQVSVENMPAELAPLVKRLNDLLQRLESAFRRERAFTADVAHELRTPLAGMRCTLEVALKRPRAGSDYREAMEECLDIVRRMKAMIDILLVLARLDDGQTAFHLEPVPLGELIDISWRPLAGKVRTRGITVRSEVRNGLACTADRSSLQMIFTSLFENAAEYTNEGGSIEIAARQAPEAIQFSIANSGCLLTEEETSHVFERFWRSDAARTHTGIHCGLGLALVQRATAALGGTVQARSENGTFTVFLTLPAA